MRYPQLIVFEPESRLAAALRPLAAERGWLLREPTRLDAALRLLEQGGPNALLIRAGRDLEREYTLLSRGCEALPDAAVVVIADDHRLQLLAWELGAACVLTAEQARERLVELIDALLREGT